MEKKINVIVDCSYVSFPLMGMDIYTTGLLLSLSKCDKINVSVLIWNKWEKMFAELLYGHSVNTITMNYLDKIWKRLPSLISKNKDYPLQKKLKKNNINVVLSPHINKNMMIFPNYIQIGVLHDLQAIKIWEYYGDLKRMEQEKNHLRDIINKIPHIICISKNTQKELFQMFDKTSVVIYNRVPNNLTGHFPKEKIVDTVLNKKYILDVNSLKKYKNAFRLVQAFSDISSRIPHVLYLKGAPNAVEEETELKELIREKQLEGRVFIDTQPRDESEMEYLYSHAEIIVSPSLMEGFGFSPVEGILHKKPVIISNIETLLETTQGLVPSFDPFSIEDISQVLYREITNPPTKEILNERASVIKKKYSTRNMIEGYVGYIIETIKDKH